MRQNLSNRSDIFTSVNDSFERIYCVYCEISSSQARNEFWIFKAWNNKVIDSVGRTCCCTLAKYLDGFYVALSMNSYRDVGSWNCSDRSCSDLVCNRHIWGWIVVSSVRLKCKFEIAIFNFSRSVDLNIVLSLFLSVGSWVMNDSCCEGCNDKIRWGVHICQIATFINVFIWTRLNSQLIVVKINCSRRRIFSLSHKKLPSCIYWAIARYTFPFWGWIVVISWVKTYLSASQTRWSASTIDTWKWSSSSK